MMVQNPVNPPLAKPLGMMKEVHAIQKMTEPTVMRK
jgi:hypothetical protein